MTVTYDQGTPYMLGIVRKMIRVACERPDALAGACRFAADTTPEFVHGLIGTFAIVILSESTGGEWQLPDEPTAGHLQILDGNDEPMDINQLSQVDRNIARILSHMAAGDLHTVSDLIAPACVNPVDAGRLLRRLCQYAHACIHHGRQVVSVVVTEVDD